MGLKYVRLEWLACVSGAHFQFHALTVSAML